MNLKKYKLYTATFFSNLISDLGDTLYSLAIMNYILLVPEKQAAIALVSISESLPIVFSVFLGYWADRTQQKVLAIISSQLFRFLLYLGAGFLLQFNPALILVISLVAINFFSDLAGKYENSLFLPIQVQLLPEADREQVLTTSQGVASSAAIPFQAMGAILVTWISFSQLAFLNAGTFLLAAGILFLFKIQLDKILSYQDSTPRKPQPFFAMFKQALKDVRESPQVLPLITILSSINALFSILIPLILAIMAINESFTIINPASTVAGISILISLSSILGNILVSTALKTWKLSRFIFLTAILSLPLFGFLILQQPWPVFVCITLMGILMGCVGPKISAFLLSHLPTERLGILNASIGTFLQGSILLAQLCFSTLLVLLPLNWILLIGFVCSLALIGFVGKHRYDM